MLSKISLRHEVLCSTLNIKVVRDEIVSLDTLDKIFIKKKKKYKNQFIFYAIIWVQIKNTCKGKIVLLFRTNTIHKNY